MALLAGRAAPGSAPGLGQDIRQLHAGPARIGFGGQRELFGDDFADIEHISRQRLRRVGLGVQHSLAAFRIVFLGQILLEDDTESIVEFLRHRLQAQNAGLHDLSPQPTLDDNLIARLQVDRHTGRKCLKSEEAEPLGQGRAFAIAGDNLQGRAGSAQSIQIYDAFNF